ncbi:MAG: hypothetical protein B6U95_02825 [Thermofilum sp. ex4484_82]|nr:MAG: hypothetical protein B6U95_02825 [Thermofilum sp. ex4484_82]OYT39070.1 MAG: hypothetical protein B6U96_02820 [Archaeoglobales archaeon ex4484_92]
MKLGWRMKLRKTFQRTNRTFFSTLPFIEIYLLSGALESGADFLKTFLAFNQRIMWFLVMAYIAMFLYNYSKIRKKRLILLSRSDIF